MIVDGMCISQRNGDYVNYVTLYRLGYCLEEYEQYLFCTYTGNGS